LFKSHIIVKYFALLNHRHFINQTAAGINTNYYEINISLLAIVILFILPACSSETEVFVVNFEGTNSQHKWAIKYLADSAGHLAGGQPRAGGLGEGARTGSGSPSPG
jgi:hypothetical protein